jgi:drug/metabolite transporter (DMT)-like permease
MILGIGFKLLSALLFTIMAALIRAVGMDAPTSQIVFARSFFALIPLMAWLAWRGEVRRALTTSRPFGHLLRGLIGVASMFLLFAALARLPLADATVLGYATPLVTVVFAAVLLRERIHIYRWSAVAVGLCGVIVALWPQLSSGALAAALAGGAGADETATGAALALGATLLTAGAMIQIRRLTQTEGTGAIVFYFSVTSAAMGLASVPVLGWVWPEPQTALLLVAIGCVGGVAQICLTESYQHADASLIAPFEYTTILWAIGIGVLAFDDSPTAWTLVGGAIVAASGLAVALRERQLGIKRARVRKAAPPSPGA